MPRLSEADKAEILEMYEAKVPVDSIADEMHCSSQAVRNVLHAAGYELPVGRPSLISQLDPAMVDAFLGEYYNVDVSVSEILAKYQLSFNNLYALLGEMGLTPRKVASENVQARKKKYDHAIAMYMNHAIPLWAIENETGINSAQLIVEVHKRGVPMRQPHSKKVKPWPPP